MKNLLFVFLFSFIGYCSVSQEKIHSIDLNKISEINAEIKSADGEIHKLICRDQKQLEVIINFLRKTEFSPTADAKVETRNAQEEWEIHLTFKGQMDHMYFFKDFVFIGKSTFFIGSKVSGQLLKKIKTNCKKC